MHIHVPDPHPGRCQNLRMRTSVERGIEYLRCLEAEGTKHTCRFPKPPPPVDRTLNVYSYTKEKTPWVVPPREDGDGD